jgi:hypothetical protein
MILKDESLIGSVVIGVEFGRDDHGLIPVIAIGRRLEPLDARTNLLTRLNWW